MIKLFWATLSKEMGESQDLLQRNEPVCLTLFNAGELS